MIEDADDLAGLIGFTAVTGELLISETDLADLDGLQCLQFVGELEIEQNPFFDLGGLDNLQVIAGRLFVISNEELESLDGLGALVTVGGVVEVAANPELEDLAGPELLTTVGSLMVIGNDAMTSLGGLVNLSAVGETMLVAGNQILPVCEVCDLLDQLTIEPATVTCSDNADDSCWTGTELSCPP